MQVSMSDNLRLGKRRIAENMVGMHVRVDDMAYRHVRSRFHRRPQTRTDGRGPPVSMTATASSPTTKPMVAMSPAFEGAVSSWTP